MSVNVIRYEYTWCKDDELQGVLDRAIQEGRELISANRDAQPSLTVRRNKKSLKENS